jgi:hypothetical protein
MSKQDMVQAATADAGAAGDHLGTKESAKKFPPTGPGPTTMTHEEWLAEGARRFGEDHAKWRFKCPVCGHIATPADWRAAGAPDTSIAFSCVGRWLPSCKDAFSKSGKGPCNYAGGGLFKLNPITVIGEDGAEVQAFEFDRPD